MMVGRAVSLNIDRPEPVNPKTRIKVENLTVRSQDGVIKLTTFHLRQTREILGIAGISGPARKSAGSHSGTSAGGKRKLLNT